MLRFGPRSHSDKPMFPADRPAITHTVIAGVLHGVREIKKVVVQAEGSAWRRTKEWLS